MLLLAVTVTKPRNASELLQGITKLGTRPQRYLLPGSEPKIARYGQMPAAQPFFYQVSGFKLLVGPFGNQDASFDVRQSLKLIFCQSPVWAEKEA